jgi:hypothetical protein
MPHNTQTCNAYIMHTQCTMHMQMCIHNTIQHIRDRVLYTSFMIKESEQFSNFLYTLVDICDKPLDESKTRHMILELCCGVGFQNAGLGLHTK